MPENEQHRTIGKWMYAQRLPQIRGRKTARWEVFNNRGIRLGMIKWENGWRQYVFWPAPHTLYAASCMEDLAAFVRSVNTAQKAGTLEMLP